MIETPDAIDPNTFVCFMCDQKRSTYRRCSHTDPQTNIRCTNQAVYYLLDNDKKRVLGGPVCEPCATACIVEYSDKLGWDWDVQEIEHGVV